MQVCSQATKLVLASSKQPCQPGSTRRMTKNYKETRDTNRFEIWRNGYKRRASVAYAD